ncbi:MAG: GIY-YIG nuclease family protein [Spirochaetia bacterium]|nr:GIY-YIG nuclease family protein [Spirochaetia bacterium]
MKNYKNEKYPTDFELFKNKIDSDCKDFINNEGMSVNDIFEIKNKKVFRTNKIKDLINENREIKGLYAFKDSNNKLVYIGISQTIIRRMRQHFYGKIHNEATLVYIQAKNKYREIHNEVYTGERKDFDFEKYGYPIQEEIRNNYRVLIQPISNNFELYYSEIFYSCVYKPFWNTFETH